MFCSKCGAEIPDNSIFCNICGNSVDKAKRKKPLGIILIIAGLIVVLFGAFLILEATGVTEVTGWFESQSDDDLRDKKEDKKDSDEDIGCEYPAPDYGYDFYGEEYGEYDFEYPEEYDFGDLSEYSYEDIEGLFGGYDISDAAEFFGAFGDGVNGSYDMSEYYKQQQPQQEEEEHTQSYYDGYGDGYY